MKKSVVILLVLTLVASLALGACAAPADKPADDAPAAEEAVDEPAEDAADEPAEDAADEPAEDAADEPVEEDAQEAPADLGNVTIGMSIPQLANPYFVSVMNGVQEQCDNYGFELTVVDAGYDVAKQVSDFENFGNQGVDAVIACPIDSNALVSVVDQLQEKDIIVISFAQIIENANAILTLDEYTYGVQIGENAAKWINEELDGVAEVLIISQDNVEAVVERGNGIQDTIEEQCPEATIVGRQAGDNPEKGMQIAEDYLQQYPDLMVITGNNDAGPLGAYEAVKAVGRNTDEFYVGGGDATPEAIEKMKEEGSVYRATVDLGPFHTGKEAVDFVKDFLENGVPDEAPVSYFRMDPVWQEDVLAGWEPEGSDAAVEVDTDEDAAADDAATEEDAA